jgi:hypothetical protein
MAFTSEAAAIAAARALLELVPFKDPSHELGVSGDPVASRLVNSHLPSGPIGSHRVPSGPIGSHRVPSGPLGSHRGPSIQ